LYDIANMVVVKLMKQVSH